MQTFPNTTSAVLPLVRQLLVDRCSRSQARAVCVDQAIERTMPDAVRKEADLAPPSVGRYQMKRSAARRCHTASRASGLPQQAAPSLAAQR